MTLALGLLIFGMCLLHLSYFLSDSVKPIKKGTMSLAIPSVSTLLLDMKVDAYSSRLNFFSPSKAVVARKKLLLGFVLLLSSSPPTVTKVA